MKPDEKERKEWEKRKRGTRKGERGNKLVGRGRERGVSEIQEASMGSQTSWLWTPRERMNVVEIRFPCCIVVGDQ